MPEHPDRFRVPGRRALARAGLALLLGATLLGAALVANDRLVRPAAEPPAWGFTHTRYSAGDGDPAAHARAEALLAERPLLQNQHIMGWGALNPEPSPGVYDFASLDHRIDLIRRTGGEPLVTLCCAPDWMKGGEPGKTDWSRIEVAPDREHWDDFAALAAKVAERYPDVRHFLVWNELKGFFDAGRNRWDHEGYTEFYNLVHDAVKRANPESRVGGPYVPVDSYAPGWNGSPAQVGGDWGVLDQRALDAIDYWLRHNRGADFVVVDGSTATKDRGLVTDEVTALGKLSATSRWIRDRTDLPLWWAEWYVEPPGAGWDERRRTAVLTAAQIELAGAGVTTALHWNPQGTGSACPGCLWTATASAGGGRPQPFLRVLQGFAREFPAGERAVPLPTGSPSVRALGTGDGRRAVAVNAGATRVTATLDGVPVSFDPYEVRWLDRQG